MLGDAVDVDRRRGRHRASVNVRAAAHQGARAVSHALARSAAPRAVNSVSPSRALASAQSVRTSAPATPASGRRRPRRGTRRRTRPSGSPRAPARAAAGRARGRRRSASARTRPAGRLRADAACRAQRRRRRQRKPRPAVKSRCSRTSGTSASSAGDGPPSNTANAGTMSAYISANCTNCESTAASGSTSRGKATFRTSVPLSTIDDGGAGERRGEEHPRQQPAQQEQRKMLDRDPDDKLERDRVDGRHQQRVGERPRESQRGALILEPQVAQDEMPGQIAIGPRARQRRPNPDRSDARSVRCRRPPGRV